MINLMLLTGDIAFAKNAESCGVDRIFFDLEYINKADRQKGRNTFITENIPVKAYEAPTAVGSGKKGIFVTAFYHLDHRMHPPFATDRSKAYSPQAKRTFISGLF